MQTKTLLLLSLIAVFAFFVVRSFSQSVGGWETFEVAETSGRDAHVVGTWVREAPSGYDPAQNVFSFTMADTTGTVRPVRYLDPKPANFEDAERLVVQGKMDGEVFVAESILVKCPSKYNDGREFEPAEPGTADGYAPGGAAPGAYGAPEASGGTQARATPAAPRRATPEAALAAPAVGASR